MIVRIALPHEVDLIWPHVAERIQQACDRTGGDLSSCQLWQMCRSQNAFLIFAADENAILMGSVWRFDQWPSGPVLRCLALGGRNLKAWVFEVSEAAIALALDGRATRLIVDGRNGWSRFFPEAKELRRTYEVSL